MIATDQFTATPPRPPWLKPCPKCGSVVDPIKSFPSWCPYLECRECRIRIPLMVDLFTETVDPRLWNDPPSQSVCK